MVGKNTPSMVLNTPSIPSGRSSVFRCFSRGCQAHNLLFSTFAVHCSVVCWVCALHSFISNYYPREFPILKLWCVFLILLKYCLLSVTIRQPALRFSLKAKKQAHPSIVINARIYTHVYRLVTWAIPPATKRDETHDFVFSGNDHQTMFAGRNLRRTLVFACAESSSAALKIGRAARRRLPPADGALRDIVAKRDTAHRRIPYLITLLLPAAVLFVRACLVLRCFFLRCLSYGLCGRCGRAIQIILHVWCWGSYIVVVRLCSLDEPQNNDSGGTWLSVLKGMQTTLADTGYEQVRLCELRLGVGLISTNTLLSYIAMYYIEEGNS